jgi:hypothetical protein
MVRLYKERGYTTLFIADHVSAYPFSEERSWEQNVDLLYEAYERARVEGDRLGVKPTEALSDREAAAIASIERSSTGLKVKFYDKMKALELLGRQLGMFDGSGSQLPQENNLLQAILEKTKEEISTDDLPELQQAAAAGHDLVESSQVETI